MPTEEKSADEKRAALKRTLIRIAPLAHDAPDRNRPPHAVDPEKVEVFASKMMEVITRLDEQIDKAKLFDPNSLIDLLNDIPDFQLSEIVHRLMFWCLEDLFAAKRALCEVY